MTTNEKRIRVTIEQMGRIWRALASLKDDLLEKNPKLFALMSEGCLDDLQRMGSELDQYLKQLKRAARSVPRSNRSRTRSSVRQNARVV